MSFALLAFVPVVLSGAVLIVLFFILRSKQGIPTQASSATESAHGAKERRGWVGALRKRTIFLDVETTGLSDLDRVVSLGYIIVDREKILENGMSVNKEYYLFNPGIPSNPGALRVHGLGDELLALQQPFPAVAAEIRETIQSADLVVGHNIEFDLKFINRELRFAGLEELNVDIFCTMNEYRKRGNYGRSAMDAIVKDIGLVRLEAHHNALADAWLAMQVFFYLHASPHYRTNIPFGFVGRPTNYVAPPEAVPKKRVARKRKQSGSTTTIATDNS
ncbi:3'-5' exonuclease [Rhodoblastus sp.]|uniref:3'-5' exonuclease n=1 Tax=Rhodoblastus sp. TaxID=1962975 RepID=UPI003F9618F7